jgi:hypothetical protein
MNLLLKESRGVRRMLHTLLKWVTRNKMEAFDQMLGSF